MNRILFERGEIAGGLVTFADVRAEHVLKVLHGEVGQVLRTGEVDGPVGTGEIVAVEGGAVTVRVSHGQPSLRPWANVVLAPPRPRVMKRLLPQLAALGVGKIVLTGARKVEKDFWGATLLKEENYRPFLIDGLMQAGTSALPLLAVRRNLRKFVNDELDAMLPSPRRILAHPYGAAPAREGAGRAATDGGEVTLAIGPEGGWTDEEVALFEAHGFCRCSLGPRILRTDTATVALLARLMPQAEGRG